MVVVFYIVPTNWCYLGAEKPIFAHALAAPGDVADRCGHPWYYRFWQQAPVLRFMKISAGGLEVGPIEA